MDKTSTTKLMYRIMAGQLKCRIFDKTFIVKNPTFHTLFAAQEIYEEALSETTYEAWANDSANKELLISLEYVSPEIDKNFSVIETEIEDLKIQLYETAFHTENNEKARKKLTAVKGKYEDMLYKRHLLDGMTKEGYAEMLKMQFIVASTLFNEDGSRVWKDSDVWNAEFSLLDGVIRFLSVNRPSQEQLRFIARTEPWRSYWNINKASPFSVSPSELSDEQKALCILSKMYDNVYEHPECPTDNIIQDDDMLDGWLIKQRRERDRERGKSVVDGLTGNKLQEAQEVYLPVSRGTKEQTEADLKRIENLNDTEGRIIKQQRKFTINRKGRVNQSELPDEKLRIQSSAQEMFKQQLNRGKGK